MITLQRGGVLQDTHIKKAYRSVFIATKAVQYAVKKGQQFYHTILLRIGQMLDRSSLSRKQIALLVGSAFLVSLFGTTA
jgi:hypothetical protein